MDSNNMNNYQQSYSQQPQYQQTPQAQYQQPYGQQPYGQQPYGQQPVYNNAGAAPLIPDQYKPIRAWGYVGYMFLFSIPLVGLIMLIIFSFSDENINRRNYARSYWCVMLIGLIFIIVLSIIAAAIGVSIYNMF
ncbi:MAG: hypothetical protein K5871_00360 [Lachnospiraceae bacterium]|nr:hypothetical protein [Lachnospiraceae bacterium]